MPTFKNKLSCTAQNFINFLHLLPNLTGQQCMYMYTHALKPQHYLVWGWVSNNNVVVDLAGTQWVNEINHWETGADDWVLETLDGMGLTSTCDLKNRRGGKVRGAPSVELQQYTHVQCMYCPNPLQLLLLHPCTIYYYKYSIVTFYMPALLLPHWWIFWDFLPINVCV